MAGKVVPTVDEVVAVLSRSSLPTVIIEGEDDAIVYRNLEDKYFSLGVSVMPVGGRKNVLQIFERLGEIKTRDKIAFIADKDLWVLTNIPEEYQSDQFVFTDGYSVENDVFRDCRVESVMDGAERARFLEEVQKFVVWYSLTVKRTLEKDPDADLKYFPGRILDDALSYGEKVAPRDDEIFPAELAKLIGSDYARYIRGKSLMQLANRQLLRKGREPKINPSFFMGTAHANPGDHLTRIFSQIGKIFGATAPGVEA
jgi:hypothetical protein